MQFKDKVDFGSSFGIARENVKSVFKPLSDAVELLGYFEPLLIDDELLPDSVFVSKHAKYQALKKICVTSDICYFT